MLPEAEYYIALFASDPSAVQSVGQYRPRDDLTTQARLEVALSDLLDRAQAATGPYAEYVVIATITTPIQVPALTVSGGYGNALLFSVPLASLRTEHQRNSARTYFAAYDCNSLTGSETSLRYEVDFGQRVHDAALAILKAFSDVFDVRQDANCWIYADFECGTGGYGGPERS